MHTPNFIVLSIAMITLLLSGCSTPRPTEIDPLAGYATHTVTSESMTATQHRAGIISPVQEVTITPEVAGKITYFGVDIGDTVIAGQRMIQIDSDETATQGAAANSMVAALQAVKISTANSYDGQIQAMEQQLAQANKQLEIAKTSASGEGKNQTDSLRIVEQQLTTVQKQLENIENLYGTQQQTILSNTEEALNQAYIITIDVLDYTDRILGLTTKNKIANDTFESKLGASNTTTKLEAEKQWKQLDIQKQDLEKQFTTLRAELKQANLLDTATKRTITALLDKSIYYMQDLQDFLKTMQIMFDNTIPGSTLSESQLSQFVTTISNYQNQVGGIILTAAGDNLLGLKGSKQMIEGLESQYSLEITQVQQQIKTLEAEKEAIENGTDTKTTIADQQVSIQESANQALYSQLNSLRQEKQAKLAEIDTQIAATRGQASQARVMADNAQIVAPFDGVILERYVDQGAVIGPGIPLLKIGDRTDTIIELYLPEEFRDQLVLGDIVTAEIKGETIFITVDQIAPTTDPISKTILFKFTLPREFDAPLGSPAKVYLDKTGDISETHPTIPRSFVRYQYGQPYVRLRDQQSEQTTKQHIGIIACQQHYCSIDSGISNGDLIIKM